MAEGSESRPIPVVYEFDWRRVEGLAEYDQNTGVLTMKIQPSGTVHELLSRDGDAGEIRTLSFGWTPKQALVAADNEDSETALGVLLRLSEESTDGRLRDAIALVRSALHDQVESRS